MFGLIAKLLAPLETGLMRKLFIASGAIAACLTLWLVLYAHGIYRDAHAFHDLAPAYAQLTKEHAETKLQLANADAAIVANNAKALEQQHQIELAQANIATLREKSALVVEKIRTVRIPGKCDDAVDWAISYGESRGVSK